MLTIIKVGWLQCTRSHINTHTMVNVSFGGSWRSTEKKNEVSIYNSIYVCVSVYDIYVCVYEYTFVNKYFSTHTDIKKSIVAYFCGCFWYEEYSLYNSSRNGQRIEARNICRKMFSKISLSSLLGVIISCNT